MDDAKKERLAKNGWTVGTVSEFLDLTSEEATLVEIKLARSRHLKQRRQQLMTQTALAERLQSSQPRIAKAENGDASGEHVTLLGRKIKPSKHVLLLRRIYRLLKFSQKG